MVKECLILPSSVTEFDKFVHNSRKSNYTHIRLAKAWFTFPRLDFVHNSRKI